MPIISNYTTSSRQAEEALAEADFRDELAEALGRPIQDINKPADPPSTSILPISISTALVSHGGWRRLFRMDRFTKGPTPELGDDNP